MAIHSGTPPGHTPPGSTVNLSRQPLTAPVTAPLTATHNHISMCFYWKAGEDRVSIVPSLESNILLKENLHPRQPGKNGWLIQLTAAPRMAIDFLQGNQVWLNCGDHPGNAGQIKLPVDSLPVVNVVAQHADRQRLSGSR